MTNHTAKALNSAMASENLANLIIRKGKGLKLASSSFKAGPNYKDQNLHPKALADSALDCLGLLGQVIFPEKYLYKFLKNKSCIH